MIRAALADMADINPRLTRPAPEEPVAFLGMADVDAATGTTSAGETRPFAAVAKGYTPFLDGDLLVAKITPCFENGKIAQAKLRHPIGMGSTEFHVIRPKPEALDSRYALHMLRTPAVRAAGERRMTGSAGQRRVPAAFLQSLLIPLPPLGEQRRIADTLDRADALRGQHLWTTLLLDDLVRSIFFEMFVKPASAAWDRTTVDELVDCQEGGIRTGPFGSQLLHSEFVDEGIAVLGIDNIVENRFKWGKARHITEPKYQELRRYTVRPGDVLITIMGTCGRVAVAPNDIPVSINTKHLCCITLDHSRCLPSFLHSYFLFHPEARSYLERTAKGAIMSGLNMGIVKNLPVKLPPIGLQRIFVNTVEAVRQNAAMREAAARKGDALLTALQARAFRGEL